MNTTTVFNKNEDGSLTYVETIVNPGPSPEDLIAEKEAQLLEMYEELQALKNNTQQ